MKLKISFIIVCYNTGELLETCLTSLLKKCPDQEYIAVDNHPEHPDTARFSAVFPEVRFIESPENGGFGAGNNLGASNAKGNILFFLNPDTEVMRFETAKLLKAFAENRDRICGFPLVYPNGKYCKPLKYIPELDFLYPKGMYNRLYKRVFSKDREVSRLMYISGAAFALEKSLYEKAGGMDEEYFLFFEENDLRMSLKKIKSYTPYVLSEGFSIIHNEGTSYSRNAITWQAQSLYHYSLKWNKLYLIRLKLLGVTLSYIKKRLLKKDTLSSEMLYRELKGLVKK